MAYRGTRASTTVRARQASRDDEPGRGMGPRRQRSPCLPVHPEARSDGADESRKGVHVGTPDLRRSLACPGRSRRGSHLTLRRLCTVLHGASPSRLNPTAILCPQGKNHSHRRSLFPPLRREEGMRSASPFVPDRRDATASSLRGQAPCFSTKMLEGGRRRTVLPSLLSAPTISMPPADTSIFSASQ